jgi:predicted TIM-barrel fold metal-dependent hydrolase
MEIIDAQVHAWDAPTEQFPWDPDLVQRALPPGIHTQFAERPVRMLQLVGMMNAVGVDGALLTSPTVYGADHSYAFATAAAFPGRFGVVAPLYPTTKDVESRVHHFRDEPYAVGIRVIALSEWDREPPLTSDGYEVIFGAAEEAGVPVFVTGPGRMGELSEIARRHPDLRIVIDHLGINASDPNVPPLSQLPELLGLATFDNVHVKCVAAPKHSAEPYPFVDLRAYVTELLEGYGIERVMWGTDITQNVNVHTYAEAVDWVRRGDWLSEAEKELLLGGNIRRLLWPSVPAPV